MAQIDIVKELLQDNPDGVCGAVFLQHYIPRFGGLIHTLRHEKGWDIATEACNLHKHRTHQYKYRLIADEFINYDVNKGEMLSFTL